MKKQLLGFFAMSLTGCMFAQSSPVVEWGKLIDGDTSAGDQATSVNVNSEGDVYWFGSYGSTEVAPEVRFGGTPLYTGALYNAGNSQNNNFTLLKTNAAGEKLWVVYSNSGDFANNAGGTALTSDGGCVVISKVRHTDGMLDRNISLFDADGNETAVEWICNRRYYRMMVTKVSADGHIEWNRMLDFSTEPAQGAAGGDDSDFRADTFNVGAVAVDADDNIYVALNYRSPLTVAKAGGGSETLVPVNTANWSGDPQTACGDFLLLGLDKQGYYRNSLTLEGTATAAYCSKLRYAGGKLFAQGYIIGDGSELKAADKVLKPSLIMSPLVLCADTDLQVQWAKCFPGEQVAGKNALQNCGLEYLCGALWFVGQYNLKFSDPDDDTKFIASTQGQLREGFVVKLDAADGKWLAARDSRDDEFCQGGAFAKTGLTGYMSVMANPEKPDNIYVLGYVMNANVGVFIRRYDAATLVADLNGEFNLITKGGAPSLVTSAYDAANGVCYIAARGNKAFGMSGSDDSAAPASWGILAAKVKLPAGMQTSISDVSVGGSENAPVEYYNLQGVRVAEPANGIFIRRQGSKVEKVAVR